VQISNCVLITHQSIPHNLCGFLPVFHNAIIFETVSILPYDLGCLGNNRLRMVLTGPMEEVKALTCDDMDKGFAVECDGIRWE